MMIKLRWQNKNNNNNDNSNNNKQNKIINYDHDDDEMNTRNDLMSITFRQMNGNNNF